MVQARRVRRSSATGHRRRPIAGWVWMLAGMLAGLAVAAVLYLQGADRIGQDFDWLTQDPTPAPAAPAGSPGTPPGAAPEQSRFQFYELLPRDEVQIPGETPAATVAPRPAPTPPPAEPAPRPSARVLLQTGSFREFAQADEMKARLALMGLQANIREVRVGGQTFHRVYLGPFESEAQADRAAESLRRANIEVLRLPASG